MSFNLQNDLIDKMYSTNNITLKIDGKEFPELSNYTFYWAKSYLTDVKRSSDGSVDLENYATVITARLRIGFKFMPAETYRTLMQMILQKNTFQVQCYDMTYDKVITKEMYFYPKDFPQIFQKDLKTLAIIDESFELVGTNNDLEQIEITYNSNYPDSTPNVTSSITINNGSDYSIGQVAEGQTDPFSYTATGYKLYCYNTKADGTGINLFESDSVIFTQYTTLYAVWFPANQFVLSFDYQGATGGNTEYSRYVTKNQSIGTLPTPTKTGYTFRGWYIDNLGNLIPDNYPYVWSENITLYAKFV